MMTISDPTVATDSAWRDCGLGTISDPFNPMRAGKAAA